MTIPTHRKADTIELSVQKHIKDNFVTPQSMTGKVNFGDSEFTIDGIDEWVDVVWLSDGAGRRGVSMLQLDVYTRIKGKISGGDRLGVTCRTLARKLYEAMHVDAIQLYDYSVPASPVLLSGHRIMVLKSDGSFREPEETVVWRGYEDGINRRTLTYRLLLPDDIAGSQYYD